MFSGSRNRRRSRVVDELAGERGGEDRTAIRWGQLESHPLIKLLFARYGEVQKDTGEAIEELQQGASDTLDAVTAAQADATAAGQAANQALLDAAAAKADWDTFKAEYQAVTVEVDGSGYIAGWRATAWADLDGSGGGVLELLGDVIVPGTLAANRLVIGTQGNLFANTDFLAPLAPNWFTLFANGGAGAATFLSIRPAGSSWAWSSFPVLQAFQNNGSTTGDYRFTCLPVRDIAGNTAVGYAVSPGERVSFSARVSAHRCTCRIWIEWFDGNGAFVATTANSADPGYVAASNTANTIFPTGGVSNNPDTWHGLFIIAQAPAGAAYARPVFYKGPSGSGDANSLMLLARPMFCRTHSDATSPTPYSPEGTTLIDGDRILTGSITADKAQFNSLAALGLTVGNADIVGSIQSDNFSAGSQGWRITKSGLAEFNVVFVRTELIAPGAVSTLRTASGSAPSVVWTAPADGRALFVCSYELSDAKFSGSTALSMIVNGTLVRTDSVRNEGSVDDPDTVEKIGVFIHSEEVSEGDFITVTTQRTLGGSGSSVSCTLYAVEFKR